MKRFLRHQKRILRKSVLISIMYITALLYFVYNTYLFAVNRSAAVKFAKEELIILTAGIVIGLIVHFIVKAKRTGSLKFAR